MSERGVGVPYPPCPQCSGQTRRIMTQITVQGADTSRAPGAEYSHALSDGVDPVYVKDRRTWKDLMKAQGVRPAEDGESECARVAHTKGVRDKGNAAVNSAMEKALRVAGEAGSRNLKNELNRVRETVPEVKAPWESPSA